MTAGARGPECVVGLRPGAVLLEVMVALTVLVSLAGSAAWHTREWLDAIHRTHREESDVRDAQRLLSAVSLWPVEDLDRHLGSTAQGRWRLLVEKEGSLLYDIAIVDTTASYPVLDTVLFRDPPEAP